MNLSYNLDISRESRIEELEEDLVLIDREITIARGRLLSGNNPDNGRTYAKLLHRKRVLGREINELIKYDDVFGSF